MKVKLADLECLVIIRNAEHDSINTSTRVDDVLCFKVFQTVYVARPEKHSMCYPRILVIFLSCCSFAYEDIAMFGPSQEHPQNLDTDTPTHT